MSKKNIEKTSTDWFIPASDRQRKKNIIEIISANLDTPTEALSELLKDFNAAEIGIIGTFEDLDLSVKAKRDAVVAFRTAVKISKLARALKTEEGAKYLENLPHPDLLGFTTFAQREWDRTDWPMLAGFNSDEILDALTNEEERRDQVRLEKLRKAREAKKAVEQATVQNVH